MNHVSCLNESSGTSGLCADLIFTRPQCERCALIGAQNPAIWTLDPTPKCQLLRVDAVTLSLACRQEKTASKRKKQERQEQQTNPFPRSATSKPRNETYSPRTPLNLRHLLITLKHYGPSTYRTSRQRTGNAMQLPELGTRAEWTDGAMWRPLSRAVGARKMILPKSSGVFLQGREGAS